MFTMTLLGLWHGAAWTLVLWGTWNGIWMSIEHWSNGRLGRRFPAWVRWFVAFHLIVIGLVLFRSQNLDLFGVYVERFFDWAPATLWTFPVVLCDGARNRRPAPTRAADPPGPAWIEQRHPAILAAGLAAVVTLRRRHGPEPGCAPVHLLPILNVPPGSAEI